MLFVNPVVVDDTTCALMLVGMQNRSERKKSGRGDQDMNECDELARCRVKFELFRSGNPMREAHGLD